MTRGLIAGFAAALMCSASAFAADMPVKAPSAAAPAAFDWSGWYIGGDAGWQRSRIGLSDPDPGFTLTYHPRYDSFALGAHIGAQRQFGQFVFGVEGGYLAGFGEVSLGATPAPPIFSSGGFGTAQTKLRDLWNIGGRAGWAMGNWMLYVAGGYANGAFQYDAKSVPPTLGNGFEHAKATTGGAYIGGGTEWALLNNLIFGVEYRHYFFSAKTVTSEFFNGVSHTPGFSTRFDPSTDTVLARLSYKFGGDPWGKAPVVAKY